MIVMHEEGSNINENSDFEDSDVSYDEEEEDSTESTNESVASSAFSQPPSPPPHTFRLISDVFSDRRPSELPRLEVDFSEYYQAFH